MVIINDVKDITGLLIDEPVLKNTSKVIEITRDEFLKAARDYDDYVNRMSSINYEHDIESYDLIKSTREYLGFELLVINVDKRFFKVYFDNEINSIKSVCLINDKGDEEILDVESIVSSNIELSVINIFSSFIFSSPITISFFLTLSTTTPKPSNSAIKRLS